MASEPDMRHREQVHRALEVSIHVGLAFLLVAACLLILRPFLPLIAWGIVIAIAVYPAYLKLLKFLGGRSMLTAVICTLILMAVLIIPVSLMAGALVKGMETLAIRLKDGTSIIPRPPPNIASWPLIGAPLAEVWNLASTNMATAIQTFGPQLRSFVPELLSASATIGLEVLQWLLSILVAGVLLANASGGAQVAHLLAGRLFGERGPEFERLAGSTIRSVTTGIIGVALIQSFFAALGFIVFAVPGAGLWAAVFLFAAVLQVGGLVLIPAVIYMFAIASTTKAVFFVVWCVVVGVMDNVLKPLLLGRGVAVPIAVVFLGAIGGFVAMGIIGLFVGAIILSVGYKLSIAWLAVGTDPAPNS